jgi:non-ribosomal peptide synthetase component F
VLAKATAASVYHVGIAWDRRTGAVYVPTDADGAVLAISPAA